MALRDLEACDGKPLCRRTRSAALGDRMFDGVALGLARAGRPVTSSGMASPHRNPPISRPARLVRAFGGDHNPVWIARGDRTAEGPDIGDGRDLIRMAVDNPALGIL